MPLPLPFLRLAFLLTAGACLALAAFSATAHAVPTQQYVGLSADATVRFLVKGDKVTNVSVSDPFGLTMSLPDTTVGADGAFRTARGLPVGDLVVAGTVTGDRASGTRSQPPVTKDATIPWTAQRIDVDPGQYEARATDGTLVRFTIGQTGDVTDIRASARMFDMKYEINVPDTKLGADCGFTSRHVERAPFLPQPLTTDVTVRCETPTLFTGSVKDRAGDRDFHAYASVQRAARDGDYTATLRLPRTEWDATLRFTISGGRVVAARLNGLPLADASINDRCAFQSAASSSDGPFDATRITVKGVCGADGRISGTVEVAAGRMSGYRSGVVVWQTASVAGPAARSSAAANREAAGRARAATAGRIASRDLRVSAVAARCDGTTSYMLYHYAPAAVRFDSVRDLLRYASRVRPQGVRVTLPDGSVRAAKPEGYDAAALQFISSLDTKVRPPRPAGGAVQVTWKDHGGRHTATAKVRRAGC